jgi:chromosome segregation ATPase
MAFMKWLADNFFSIIALVGSLLGLLVGFVKMNESMKSKLDEHQREIDELRGDLLKEKEQNKENYLKQDSKLEEAISNINNRLDKIDEMNSSINSLKMDIATLKNDMSYVKEDLKELKTDFKEHSSAKD